jgi:glucose-6-phosphate 1-epimerase
MNMDVENTGDEEMAFTCLLRTYFRVNDIKKASVMGFKGCEYVTANEIAPGTFTDGREKATIERERRIASI